MTRVLIIGGYGVFGARLVRLLCGDDRLSIVIGGRRTEKAQALIRTLSAPSRVTGTFVDTETIGTAIDEVRPDLIIHCAGPFQGQDYRVAREAISKGVSYADLSDGRAFSEGFSILDEDAKCAGVFALTAASTTTALTSAVARILEHDFDSIDRVRIGVSPGNRAPRGKAVVSAILGYVGEAIPWRSDGVDATRTGWGDLHRITLGDIGPRWFSPCDAPDIALMRQRYPAARDIEFRAGLELGVLHLSLYALAHLRRRRLLPNLAGAAGLFHWLASLFEPFGSDQGGMYVEMTGNDKSGRSLTKKWTLTAKGGDGPSIPAMACAAIARKVASGETIAPGARMADGEVSLADFEQEFSRFSIQTDIETIYGDIVSDAPR